MMLYLGWIFLWLVTGERIKEMTLSGRVFTFHVNTVSLWSKFEVTDNLIYQQLDLLIQSISFLLLRWVQEERNYWDEQLSADTKHQWGAQLR